MGLETCGVAEANMNSVLGAHVRHFHVRWLSCSNWRVFVSSAFRRFLLHARYLESGNSATTLRPLATINEKNM